MHCIIIYYLAHFRIPTWVFVILDDMYNLPEHMWNEVRLLLLKQLLHAQNFYVIFVTVLYVPSSLPVR